MTSNDLKFSDEELLKYIRNGIIDISPEESRLFKIIEKREATIRELHAEISDLINYPDDGIQYM